MLREITVHQFTFMSLSAVQMIHFIYFDSIHVVVVVVVVVIVEVAVIVVVEVVVVVKLYLSMVAVHKSTLPSSRDLDREDYLITLRSSKKHP